MIAVVGGGIAGLAAAHRLQERGFEVRVYEASDSVGGLAALYETAGDPIERFYHHLSKSEETIVELATDLGVDDRIEWRIGKNAYYVDGVVHPLDTAAQIAAYPHLSLYDKFRLGMLTLGVDVRGGRPRFDTYDDLTAFEDVPVREFVEEHTTPGVYERFFYPLLDAKFGDRKEDVSAAWLLGRVRFRGERDLRRGEILGYFDGSFGVLLDALVESVGRERITTNARVVDVGVGAGDGGVASGDGGVATEAGSVASDGSNVASDGSNVADEGSVAPERSDPTPGDAVSAESVTVETPDGTETHDAEAVVVAAMPNVLESLTGYECTIDFQGAVCAVVTMDRQLMDTYWLNIADDAPFGALIEHTNFVPPERYGGQHLLYVASYVQSRDDWRWQADDDELAERWLDGVADLFPSFDREHVASVRISRNPRAAPVYERGYLESVIPYDLSETVADGVYYAGMASRAQYPERSLNGGIVAGFECADRIADAR